ncbi:MAG: hypothetical protein ACW99G_04790 [Candidatus Thorarchaeota archaeon]
MERYILFGVFDQVSENPVYVGNVEWDEMSVDWEFDEELAGLFNGQEVDHLLSFPEFKDLGVEQVEVNV